MLSRFYQRPNIAPTSAPYKVLNHGLLVMGHPPDLHPTNRWKTYPPAAPRTIGKSPVTHPFTSEILRGAVVWNETLCMPEISLI